MKNKLLAATMVVPLLFTAACSLPVPQSRPSESTATSFDVPAATSFDAQAYVQSVLEYVANASVPIDALANQVDFLGFEGYNVVLMGEEHATVSNYTAEFEMLKFLNSTYGATRFIAEIGYADAFLLNQYLNTGNRKALLAMVEAARGTSYGSEALVGFYENIYALNQSLPEERRLTVFAGDIQHALGSAAYAMYSVQPEQAPPAAIASDVDLLARHGEMGGKESDLFNQFRDSFKQNESVFEAWLGENTFQFYREILHHTEARDVYYVDRNNAYREARMIECFESAFETAPGEMWVGIFGGAHTYLNGPVWNTDGGQNLANHLMHNCENTAGRVASITFCYYNSEYMDGDGTAKPMEPRFPFLDPAYRSLPDISLCPLDTDGSPFGPPNDRSLETQQYLMLIQNSAATAPI